MITPPRGSSRHLALIDGENLAGSCHPTTIEVAASVRAFNALGGHDPGMHVVVACSHHNAPTVSFAWSSARHLWRSGRDGADLALLEVIAEERVAERFDKVTIGSGDGFFTAAAAWLAGQGVVVRVVGRHGAIATSLRLASHEVVELALDTVEVQALGR